MANNLCFKPQRDLDDMTHSGFNDPLSVSTSVAPNFLQPTLPTFCRIFPHKCHVPHFQTELFTFSTKLALPLVVQISNQKVFSGSSPSFTPHQIGDSASTAYSHLSPFYYEISFPFWPPDLFTWILK